MCNAHKKCIIKKIEEKIYKWDTKTSRVCKKREEKKRFKSTHKKERIKRCEVEKC